MTANLGVGGFEGIHGTHLRAIREQIRPRMECMEVTMHEPSFFGAYFVRVKLYYKFRP